MEAMYWVMVTVLAAIAGASFTFAFMWEGGC